MLNQEVGVYMVAKKVKNKNHVAVVEATHMKLHLHLVIELHLQK